jgi:hypothetical protein
MGQAGAAGRHHQACRHHQVEAGHLQSRWVVIDVMVQNQAGEKVATGEAMAEFPLG